ncbi:MAG TPA: DUF4172 domain-containing protein [Rhabdochlamydiaceae bacterium]|nr:DUF4172 domain-containing protein [Rhabdochlamydiaceae bacterium]
MVWNWELPEWPLFKYNESAVDLLEKKLLVSVGSSSAYLKAIDPQERDRFVIEMLSMEGIESSRIEGEILNRESLQSSIQKHFGLKTDQRIPKKEEHMAQLLCDVYESYDRPLTHEMLWHWHSILFEGETEIKDRGKYRTHAEPMQIVSHRLDSTKVFFEAPPSIQVFTEMSAFINWFNATKDVGSILGRAAIAHLYFESIHPFEDGNGRIGRLLVEKVLSQSIHRPILIAVSKRLEKRKKEYYAELERCNRTLEVQNWVEFFSSVILQAHEEAMTFLYFLIEKAKMLHRLSDSLNPRQTKVLLRMFEEGPNGFKGGLSAENYISITKTTRATATRDLHDLVEKNALKKTGKLRHTRYQLNLKSEALPELLQK